MEHIVPAVVILLLIIGGMFGYAYFKKAELEKVTIDEEVSKSDISPYSSITTIDAKHFFQNNEHTIVGEIPMPTPCDLLNWTIRVAESFPEQVTIDFAVVNNAEVCTQVVTPQRFKIPFKSSKDASIGATLQGRPVILNLIPGLPGETPDDFELFIKG
jgi:hypothetical protein